MAHPYDCPVCQAQTRVDGEVKTKPDEKPKKDA